MSILSHYTSTTTVHSVALTPDEPTTFEHDGMTIPLRDIDIDVRDIGDMSEMTFTATGVFDGGHKIGRQTIREVYRRRSAIPNSLMALVTEAEKVIGPLP